jgi:hypothetical protein
MSEILPNFETEVAERDRLVVLNEKYLARRSFRRDQVLRRKDMRICHIVDVRDIPKIGAIPYNPRCLLLGETSVYRWKQLRVALAEQN